MIIHITFIDYSLYDFSCRSLMLVDRSQHLAVDMHSILAS